MKVAVIGAKGRMGATVVRTVEAEEDLDLVAAVDQGDSLDPVADADVAVVFTAAGQASEALEFCAATGVHTVIGTTGFTTPEIERIEAQFSGGVRPNAALIPNFAIGAVLMMRLCEIAAPHFQTVEVLEFHHNNKVDAPSGTAVATAEKIAAARAAAGAGPMASDPTTSQRYEGSRGGAGPEGVRVHAIRMVGRVADQEVIMGTTGQTLTIRHDTTDRESFMPGVLLAVRGVKGRPGFTYGLEAFLGLS